MQHSHLIPVPKFQSGFTTCATLVLQDIEQVVLEDAPLGVHKVTSRTSHHLVAPPPPLPSSEALESGSREPEADSRWPAPPRAWEALYPKGSINPAAPIPGGFGFYLAGPAPFATKLSSGTGAVHVVLSYRMMLQEGWEWVKGGKLPGIFGGEGDFSYACTGGRQDNRCRCFNIRPMWRAQGLGELYTYLPLTPSNRARLLAVPPMSKENPDYGVSVGRGAFTFTRAVGGWISLAFRVKLNAVGHEDGELELWVDGRSVINVSGLTFRESDGARIKGGHFQTFFGGHQDDWASPKDQRAWFADVTGVVIE
ncbi:polysaccharide lyase family 14 protein [Mycena pura]|uniref:Polysaccharide lyase family 14 protein n=1 Tax=Mycena pura TaxID=153505 RepID=A0AAD6VIN7_9AGAR|nr:polysaccharide lyase family 14 protein [Mycena pura]